MPVVEPYLMFDGNCAEAFRFYEKTLGGKIEHMMTYGENPECGDQTFGPEVQNRMMHVSLVFENGDRIMASDDMPGRPYEGMKGISITLSYPTEAEGRRIFTALAEGGQVVMPYDKTFWAEGFGMCVDRFGTPWMINGGVAPSPAEKQ